MSTSEIREICPELSDFSVRPVGSERRDGAALEVADVAVVAESLHARRAGAYFFPETRLSWTDEYRTGVCWEYQLGECQEWVDPLDAPINKKAGELALPVDDVAEPAVVHPAALRRYCMLAEATTLLARAWTPARSRILIPALSGVLIQGNWDVPAITRLLSAVWAVAGEDLPSRLDEKDNLISDGLVPAMGSPYWRTVLRDLVGDQAVERVIGALELRFDTVGT